jgi:DNA replication protein DnaC
MTDYDDERDDHHEASERWEDRERPDDPEGVRTWFDPSAPPKPLECDCGRVSAWTWWRGSERHRVRPRWTAPKVSPCVVCAPVREAEEAAKVLARRQHDAGIPVRYREYRWDRYVTMGSEETWGGFMRRVKASDPPAIGITRKSVGTARALRDWTPAMGSMYLHGPVGSGKSLMVAATCTALLSTTTGRREVIMETEEVIERYGMDGLEGATSLRRDVWIDPGGASRPVCYIDEDTMVQRVMDGWSKDKDPLGKIAEHPCLVLDDLGTVAGLGGKRGDLAAQMVRRVVAYRYDRRLPMLVTSNAPMAELDRHYDHRTVSRLAEMVGGREHAIEGLPAEMTRQGFDWRRPPPEDGRRADAREGV